MKYRIKSLSSEEGKEIIRKYYPIAEGTLNKDFPIPLNVISNQMGINLCSVEGMEEVKRKDGQLISVRVDFNPVKKED
jgi:hypothetical protein